MGFNFLLQIQTVPSVVKGTSVWDIISQSNTGIGWLVNIILVILLGYVIYTFTERFIALRRNSSEDGDFLQKVKSHLMEGNIDAAKKHCSNSDIPAARIVEKGIERLGKPNEGIYNTLENASRLEILQMQKKNNFLKLTSFIAPFLGLLASSISIIIVCNQFQDLQELDLKTITKDLSPLLFTSAFGFIIGILSFSTYTFLNANVLKIQLSLEETTLEFMNALYGPA
jgi:biopolymer transport protein ExbB